MTLHCPAVDNPNSTWPPFCPSVAAAYVMAVLFGLTLVMHISQAIYHRKFYSAVIIVSALAQTGNFVIRIMAIHNPTNQTLYSDFFILMMIAPIWTNAFTYMVMGRMVYNFTQSGSILKISAWRFGLVFVLLDVVAFLIQLGGLAMLSGNTKNPTTVNTGIHIYMGGIGFQLACIFFFVGVAVKFHLRVRQQPKTYDKDRAIILLYVEYVVVTLIAVRIIFRLIEYSHGGINSPISLHEVYEYIFDSTVMWIASVLFNIAHPGRLMPGKASDFPSRKARKAMRERGEVPHGRAEEYLLVPGGVKPVDAV